tara:strand:- start:3 stop:794 length:792 start_codon:yes stop_codon:yes gene_type:complete
MIRHLGTKITSFLIFASFLLAGLPAQSDDHQNSEIKGMSNGTIEAAQLTLCTLNSGKTLKDAEKLIPSILGLHKEINLNSFFGLMTPLFVSRQSTIDFIFADFAPFDGLSSAWDQFLVSQSGAKLQASIDKVATCNRSLHRYYHQFTRYSDDDRRVLSINWCTKKDEVSMENLMAKHRSFAEPPNKHILHWGIAAPAWGVRTGDIQGDFAHFVGYPDMKAALADQSDIAIKGGWKERRDYFSSYANCSGENLWKFDIANIPAS